MIVGAFVALARWVDLPDAGSARARPAVLLLVAGGLLGLAGLTRSTALAFVPLVALWAGWVVYRRMAAPRRGWWRAPLLLLLGVAVFQVPLMGYNAVTYHRLILGDTSSGYNLWLASVGVRDGERLAADLLAIPDPGARQSYAYAQAFTQIAADPGAFLGKGLKESLDLWRINFTSEERQVGGFTEGRVPAAHLWALLIFQDLLYVAITLCALAGLALGPPDPLKALLGLWTLLWMAMAFVFFAVTRFRFPVIALLLPWVPLGVAALAQAARRMARGGTTARLGRPAWRPLGLGLLGLLFLGVVAPSIPFGPTADGAARWAAQAPYRAALPLIRTDPGRALDLLAQADQALPATQFAADAARLLQITHAPAPDPAALAALDARPEIALAPNSPLLGRMEPYLLSGAIARARGDPAAAAGTFGARPVHVAGPDAVSWAATFLPRPIGAVLAIGSGLDFGAVDGFYASEQAGSGADAVTYRWSGPVATIHLTASTPGQTVVIRWSGARPAGVPAARVVAVVRAGTGAPVATTVRLPARDTWQETTLARLPTGANAVDITLDVNPFVPGGYDPRALGVRVAAVTLR